MKVDKKLLQNLGAKLRQMMVEEWRGEDEQNTLGMAGFWLERMGGHDNSEKPSELGPLIGYLVLKAAEADNNAMDEKARARHESCQRWEEHADQIRSWLRIIRSSSLHNDQGMGREGTRSDSNKDA